MVMLPQTVRLEPSVINGVKVVKQVYADGSYGIQDENTGCVKVYYQDGKKQWFLPIDDVYKLTAEEMPDGKMTFAQKDGIVKSESEKREVTKYRRVEPLDWDSWPTTEEYTVSFKDYKFTFFDGSVYGVSVDDNHYLDNSQFIKTNQFSELNVDLRCHDSWKGRFFGGEVKIVSEKSFDGSEHKWEGEDLSEFAKLSDGTERKWYKDGILESEKLPDGTERTWYENGNMREEYLPDGTERVWYENGNLGYEKLPDGSVRTGEENGEGEATLADGTKQYFVDGKISSEKLIDGTRRTYDDGVLVAEYLLDNTTRRFYPNGQMSEQKLPNGSSAGWYIDGSKKFEEQPNGSRQEWHLNGNLSAEILCSKVDKHKISETRYDENGNRTHFEHYNKEGKDDTRMYLARKKVAADQAKKSEEIRAKGVEVKNSDGTTRKKTTVKKLNPIVKAWKLRKALKDVDARK